MVGACGGGGARSGGGGANGLVRLPVSQRDGEVIGPGEAEAFAQEAEVPAPVAAAADAEAVDEVEGAGDGGGERGRPGPRRGGGLRGRRVLAVVGGVVADVLGRVAAVELAEEAPGGAEAAAARRRRRGVLRGVGRAHRRRPQLMGALEDAGERTAPKVRARFGMMR